MKIRRPTEYKEKIRDYYRDAELWLPPNPSWRVYRFERITDNGTTRMVRLKERVTDKETLRDKLVRIAPINAYFSVSYFLNPSTTAGKTWKHRKENNVYIKKKGNRHDNNFMFSDAVVDCDHTNTEQVKAAYRYMRTVEDADPDDLYTVFSGGGFHVNSHKHFRHKDISDPIDREIQVAKEMQQLGKRLINKGIAFDYIMDEDGEIPTNDMPRVSKVPGTYDYVMETKDRINSPTCDTRRVRKLPGTLTKYGNRAERVAIETIDQYTPTQVIPSVKQWNTVSYKDINQWIQRYNNDYGGAG